MIGKRSKNLHFFKTPRENENGQSLVELALAMPLLVLILVGAVEIARVAYTSIEVTNAAKAGAQAGGFSRANAGTSGIPAVAAAAAADAPDITLGTIGVTTSCICSNGTASNCTATSCGGSNVEQLITVTTQTNFDPGIHLPGLPTTYTLRGQATQKVLNQ